jgi:DNA-directed RNA polymerase subunit RPC12/RpoP
LVAVDFWGAWILMETVNFQCGNCKNLMAVESSYLGQQVRCPHCQQVLLVPAASQESGVGNQESEVNSQESEVSNQESGVRGQESEIKNQEPGIRGQESATPGPLNPELSEGQPDFSAPVPSHSEEESILAGSQGTGEPLFGADSSSPVLEMPAESVPTSPAAVEAPDQAPTLTDSLPPEAPEASGAPPSSSPTEMWPSPGPVADLTEAADSFPAETDAVKEADAGMVSELPVETPGADLSRRLAKRAKAESMLAAYLLIFLIPYAIFVTLVAGYYYWRMQQMPHPLEMLKDIGDNPPAKRGTSSVIDIIPPETNLPNKLQVALGQRIRIGDLEVLPVKVEQRPIVYCSETEHIQAQPSAKEALVLTLQLRNVSNDVFFIPTDPFFDRQWKEDSGATKPYTFLEMGSLRFFGGPIKRGQRGQAPREFIQGQEKDNQVLNPGDERITVKCTDPDNRQILKSLAAYQGQLVWRVQLRRGLVDVGNREVSATAVIGVVFEATDIIHDSRTASR